MKTQYDAIAARITRKSGATTRELIEASGSVCPWRRMAEMVARHGWEIWSKRVPGKPYLKYFGRKTA